MMREANVSSEVPNTKSCHGWC